MAQQMAIKIFQRFAGQADQMVEQLFEEQAAEIQRLQTELRALAQAFERLRQNTTEVIDNPVLENGSRPQTELERVIARHELRINKLSHEMTQQRNDLVSADQMAHQEIAHRLDTFIMQDLVGAAAPLARDEHDIASIIAELSRILFDRAFHNYDSGDLMERLRSRGIQMRPDEFNRLRQGARSLTDRARETRHGHEWTVSGDHGVPVDSEHQDVWVGADPHGVVEMIVAPGYHVGNKVYSKQYVFTRPASPPPADEPADEAGEVARSAPAPRKRTEKASRDSAGE
jgi:Skp family chaperone for outer membrane proteins